jgi:uncharacterized protein involved in exopolysaccharide biosynthesis
MYRSYFAALRRWWWLVPLGLVAALGVAVLINRVTPPRYVASVRLLIGQAGSTNDPSRYWGVLADQQVAKAYGELAVTSPVLGAVIQRLNLDTDPIRLASQVRVNLLPESPLVEIAVTSTDPSQAAAIATAIGEQLTMFRQGMEDSRARGLRAQAEQDLDQLLNQSRATEQELLQVEQQLAATPNGSNARDTLIARRDALRNNLMSWQSMRVTLYDTLLKTSPASLVTMVAPALPPATPTTPPLSRVLALAAPIGVALPLIVIFILSQYTVAWSPTADRKVQPQGV